MLTSGGSSTAITISNQASTTLKNITIQGVSTGILVSYSSSTTLDHVTVTNSGMAVKVDGSPDATVTNSDFSTGNTCMYVLNGSPRLTLHNDSFNNNKINLNLSLNLFENDWIGHSIDTTNTLDGNPIYYYEEAHDQIFSPANPAVFYCINCTNITLGTTTFSNSHNQNQLILFNLASSTITNNTIAHATDNAVSLTYGHGNTFTGNNIHNNFFGIISYGSAYNTFTSNILTENENDAILLQGHSNNTTISKNTFTQNGYSIVIESDNTTIVQNNFTLAQNGGYIFNYSASTVLSQALPIGGNYWENFDSPAEGCDDTDGDGVCDGGHDVVNTGTHVTDSLPWVGVSGWNDYVAPKTLAGNSSVLFLPGIEASRLYKIRSVTCTINCEDQLWEPDLNSDAEDLFMTENGGSVDDSIYTRDVVDEAYGGLNIYKSFLGEMATMKTAGDISDYSAVPYDWRLSFEDILASGKKIGEEGGAANISYLKATSSPYILQELRRLVASSQNSKVTIVAHSNGGLLAKALLKELADTNDPLLAKIDKLILVAVPQLGTPSAITALLHGYDQGIPFSFSPILSDKTARQLGQNLPSGYNLLPSASYFTTVDTPVVSFDATTTPDWISKYGASIESPNGLHTFLTDSYDRVASSSSDTDNPNSLRENLLASAEAEHVVLDAWSSSSTMQVVEIAGWGIPTTISGVKYSMKDGKIKIQPTWTIDGDGTVVTPSALWTNGVASTTKYWINMDAYNFLLNRIRDGHFKDVKHANILEIPEFLDFIKNDLLIENTTILETFISTSTPTSQSSTPRLIYSLHSPLTLDIYDNLGNHTGVSTTTGQIEEQVAGTYFIQFGDVKYIFTDTSIPINIIMSGYDSGTFTFTIEQKLGDNTVSTVTFQDIPTATTTKVVMTVASDISTLSNLSVDSDNNGTVDISLAPIIGGIVTYTIPSTVVSGSTTSSPTAPVSSGGGNNGPIVQNPNIQIQISTSTQGTNIATSTSIISTSTQIISTSTAVVFQRSDLRNPLQGQTLVVKSKPTQSQIEHESAKPHSELSSTTGQTAQVISSDPASLSWFMKLFHKTVNWFVDIFK